MVDYNLSVVEDPDSAHEDRRAAGNALVQASMAYVKVVELYDLEREVKGLEALTNGNGHTP